MTAQGTKKIIKQPHHVQQELCTTRAMYRQGRKLTAVKVYTVNDESNHLLIYGVPSIGLLDEVTNLCRRYGDILPIQYVDYEDKEEFTDVFHVTYRKIQAARFAKKQIDTKNFFGKVLHVFYAPELETLTETKNKLIIRRKEINQRIERLKEEKKKIKTNKNDNNEINKDSEQTNDNQNSSNVCNQFENIEDSSNEQINVEHSINYTTNSKDLNISNTNSKDLNLPSTSHNNFSLNKIKNNPYQTSDFYKIYQYNVQHDIDIKSKNTELQNVKSYKNISNNTQSLNNNQFPNNVQTSSKSNVQESNENISNDIQLENNKIDLNKLIEINPYCVKPPFSNINKRKQNNFQFEYKNKKIHIDNLNRKQTYCNIKKTEKFNQSVIDTNVEEDIKNKISTPNTNNTSSTSNIKIINQSSNIMKFIPRQVIRIKNFKPS